MHFEGNVSCLFWDTLQFEWNRPFWGKVGIEQGLQGNSTGKRSEYYDTGKVKYVFK